jgi:ribose transport system ATP-binding protein
MTDSHAVLTIRNLSKTFPGQRALRNVSMDVTRGEVHALVGENGCGKSTLIKCVAGYHRPDDGAEISIGDRPMEIPFAPADSIAAGAAFIHQDLGLIPTLTVMENIALPRGFETTLCQIDWKAEAERSRELLASFGGHIAPEEKVGRLSHADRTLVAIARGLGDVGEGGKLLVLDEPTAALPAHDVGALFTAIRKVAELGVGIIYVSHRIGEIFEIADRVTALRDGAHAGTRRLSEVDERQVVEMIVGGPLESLYPEAAATARDEVVLDVRGLCGERVRDATFSIRRGEVVGVAGLLGSGRSELARLIFGAQPRMAGEMRIGDAPHDPSLPGDSVRAGIGLVPEDRRLAGSMATLTVRENVTITDAGRHWRGGRFSRAAERREVQDLLERFRVSPPDAERRFASLSGGNQQKAILAKWMRLSPRLLILDEPVQGVDIGAKRDIYELIEQAAAAGAATLIIDSDFADLCALCSRILVMRDGRIVEELTGEDKSRERILEIAYSKEEIR